MSTLWLHTTPLQSTNNKQTSELVQQCNHMLHIIEYGLRYLYLCSSMITRTQLLSSKSVQNILSKCLIKMSVNVKPKEKTPKNCKYTTQLTVT